MAFLVDLLLVALALIYLYLNRKLYKWRLAVTEKYPHSGNSPSQSPRAFLRGMWELLISVLLLSGLFTALLFVIYWHSRFGGHTSLQIVTMPGIIYWTYTFVFIGIHPDSRRFARWLGKHGKRLLNYQSE